MYPHKEQFNEQRKYLSKKETFKKRDKELGSSLFGKIQTSQSSRY